MPERKLLALYLVVMVVAVACAGGPTFAVLSDSETVTLSIVANVGAGNVQTDSGAGNTATDTSTAGSEDVASSENGDRVAPGGETGNLDIDVTGDAGGDGAKTLETAVRGSGVQVRPAQFYEG